MKVKSSSKEVLVSVVMGSDSDLPIMSEASKILEQFNIPHEFFLTSAHRSPARTMTFAQSAADRGIQVMIVGAGAAAHLAGVIASHTLVPVIGIPIDATSLKGLDALLSTVQMPGGIPVATVAIGGAKNAGLLAISILGASDEKIRWRMIQFKKKLAAESRARSRKLQESLKE
jgi:5-(carboxyamino)imidazole ribonucleotide mutase